MPEDEKTPEEIAVDEKLERISSTRQALAGLDDVLMQLSVLRDHDQRPDPQMLGEELQIVMFDLVHLFDKTMGQSGSFAMIDYGFMPHVCENCKEHAEQEDSEDEDD